MIYVKAKPEFLASFVNDNAIVDFVKSKLSFSSSHINTIAKFKPSNLYFVTAHRHSAWLAVSQRLTT